VSINDIAALVKEFGLAAVVILIFFKWLIPELRLLRKEVKDGLREDIQALTLILANHFRITPEELKEAKKKLNDKK